MHPLRIGLLLPVVDSDAYIAAFRTGMQSAGLSEPRDYRLDTRRADGTVAAFEALGRQLVALPPHVLVTASTAAATALSRLTTTIPVVFIGVFEPVAAGLVDRHDRPGRNLTGIAGFGVDIATEWVSLLRSIAPIVTRIGIFANPASIAPAALAGWTAAARRGFDIDVIRIDSVSDIDPAIAAFAGRGGAGIIVVPHTFPFANREGVVAAMAAHRVPAIYGIAEMVRAGGLISYGQDLADQWRVAAGFVARIAAGARPGELPVEFATRHALTINRRTASGLGLNAPQALTERADEIVDYGLDPKARRGAADRRALETGL